MSAAATPVANGAADAVVERINQYRHRLLIAVPWLRRFGLQRKDGFNSRNHVLDQRRRALAFSARAIARGLLHALFARLRLRLLRRVPGDLPFARIPGAPYRLLFDLRQPLIACFGAVRVIELRLQLREKFDGALQFLLELLFTQLAARFFDYFLDAPYQIVFAFQLFVLCLF